MEWFPVVKDAILALAAIVAGYVGLMGLSTWRRQLKGNAEYLLAKSVLKAVYELREAIKGARFPVMTYFRDPDMPEEKLKDLSEQEKKWHAIAQAFRQRWEPVPKAKANLDEAVLEAEVVWGPRIAEKTALLNGLLAELLGAIEDYLDSQNPHLVQEKPEPGELKARREIMYARGDASKDEYLRRLLATIRGIEDELRPHIIEYHR
jgi:hypothetical protein